MTVFGPWTLDQSKVALALPYQESQRGKSKSAGQGLAGGEPVRAGETNPMLDQSKVQGLVLGGRVAFSGTQSEFTPGGPVTAHRCPLTAQKSAGMGPPAHDCGAVRAPAALSTAATPAEPSCGHRADSDHHAGARAGTATTTYLRLCALAGAMTSALVKQRAAIGLPPDPILSTGRGRRQAAGAPRPPARAASRTGNSWPSKAPPAARSDRAYAFGGGGVCGVFPRQPAWTLSGHSPSAVPHPSYPSRSV